MDTDIYNKFKNILSTKGKKIHQVIQDEFKMFEGKKVLELMDIEEAVFETGENIDEKDTAYSQIIQSQLLRGGLPLHLFRNFSDQQLDAMLKIAEKGIGMEEIVQNISKAKEQRAANQDTELFNESEKFLQEIIYVKKNKFIDKTCEGLQKLLKQKGGLVASYCEQGQNDGLLLTRAAFAIMIKFSGLHTSFEEMVDQI